MFIKFTNQNEDQEIYDLKCNAKNLQNMTLLAARLGNGLSGYFTISTESSLPLPLHAEKTLLLNTPRICSSGSAVSGHLTPP